MSACTRCAAQLNPRAAMVTITTTGASSDWRLCSDCVTGLSTWYSIRKEEFKIPDSFPGTEVPKLLRDRSELLAACRTALDAAGRYPAILDTLRTAIKRALE